MSIGVRPMRDGQEEAVAAMIRQLPKDLGLSTVPKITGQNLRDWKGLGHVTVAEDSGLLLGACLWALTVSSWRGAKGIYVSDVYVMSHARGRKVGEKLLRGVAKEAEKLGARFIKLEVDVSNVGAQRFYARNGFKHKAEEQYFVMEQDQFSEFVKGGAQ